MKPADRLKRLSGRTRRRLVVLLVLALVLWVGFFDSHSLYKRWHLHRETRALLEENRELAAEIERLQTELDRELSDEEVERIAREQYGMRRDGETVYPVRK